MLSYMECLSLIRKQYPGRAVWNGSKTVDGRYSFLVANGPEIKYDVLGYYSTHIVDPDTGAIEDFYWIDHLDDLDYVKAREPLDDTIRWIDGHPPVPSDAWKRKNPEEWEKFKRQWNISE